MFYSNDKVISYPACSGLKDLLTRNGAPTQYSFTPFNGCAHIMREQFGNDLSNISIDHIISVSQEFSAHKAKANDDGAERDHDITQVVDYYTRLEDISQDFIDRYVTQQIIGYKINNNGRRVVDQEMRLTPSWFDAESGEVVSLSDIVEKEKSSTTEEIIDARSKLPYLLKQLQQGSVLYKGSLLSFIISAQKLFAINENVPGYMLKPRELVTHGVYKMNAVGEIQSAFTKAENSGETLRTLIAWVRGEYEDDVYYKAYQELLKVLAVLDLDITNEDARNYPGSYINKVVCTYLASNEEYISTYGFADRKILSMLSPDKLFTIAARVSESDVVPVNQNNYMRADSVATNTESFRIKYKKQWADDVAGVNRFLEVYCKVKGVPKKSVADYRVEKGLLAKADGTYIVLNVTGIVKEFNSRGFYAVISIAGYLIMLEEFDTKLRYISVDKAIEFYGGLDNDKEWSYINI